MDAHGRNSAWICCHRLWRNAYGGAEFVCCSGRPLVCPLSSSKNYCMSWRNHDSHTKSQCYCGEARTSGERHNFPGKRKLTNLSSKPGLDFRNFRSWRMNFRSEAMIWIKEIESTKSTSDLKTSSATTQGQVAHTHTSMFLIRKTASCLKKIINGDFRRRVFIQEVAAQKEKSLLSYTRQIRQLHDNSVLSRKQVCNETRSRESARTQR